MGFVVRFAGPRQVDLHEYPDPPLAATEVRLRTLYSGISAGTELTAYRGSNPHFDKRWDERRRLFVGDAVTIEYPVEGWGYEEVGEVVEVGAAVPWSLGDVVWGAWGHRSTSVMAEAEAADRLLAREVDPMLGIFSLIGAIALNVVLDADIHVGDWVAVFGQGPPGLIATQLARLNGGTVIAVDALLSRLELARSVGADHVLNTTAGPAAEEIKALTEGRGADVSTIHGSYRRCTGHRSTVYRPGGSPGSSGPVSGLFWSRSSTTTAHVVCSQILGRRRSSTAGRASPAAHVMDLSARQASTCPPGQHVLPVAEAAEVPALDEHKEPTSVVLNF